MAEGSHGDGSVVIALFRHNTWANLKLLDACEGLDQAQLAATVPGCYGSIHHTLVHTIGAEVSYVKRITGGAPPRSFSRGELPPIDVLKEVATWTSDELQKLALGTRQDTMVNEHSPEGSCSYTLASLIMQSITHSTEHRTQVATILTQLGIEPPDMSGWAYMVETGDYQEFPADSATS